MNWDAIGAISEGLGSIAVFVTLAYLATQIRDTRAAIIAQSYQSRANAASDLQIQIAQHDALVELMDRTNDAGEIGKLSSVERQKLFLVHRAIMNQLDNVCFQYSSGYMTDAAFDDALQSARLYLPAWKNLGMSLRPALADVLDERG